MRDPVKSILNDRRSRDSFYICHQILSAIQAGQANTRMQPMNQALVDLVERGIVDREVALSRSSDAYGFMEMLTGYKTSRRYKIG